MITVAAGFPTTVSPMIQYGAVPVFVDVTIPQYNIDPSLLEAAWSPKTKAVMLAHTLGNPFDLKAIKEFCDRHNLWLIEDNCDALGSVYTIDGEDKLTGTIGDIGEETASVHRVRIISVVIALTASMVNFRLATITSMYILILDITSRQLICRLQSDVHSLRSFHLS